MVVEGGGGYIRFLDTLTKNLDSLTENLTNFTENLDNTLRFKKWAQNSSFYNFSNSWILKRFHKNNSIYNMMFIQLSHGRFSFKFS